MEAFAEVIEIRDAREDIKQQKKEIEEQREILDRRLEEIGLGDFDRLRQVVVALMTLEQMGIGVEQIVSIVHNMGLEQTRRQERKPRAGWDTAGYINENNGHSQEYGYNDQGYGYN